MRKLFLLFVSVAAALSGYAQCNELFFSEYLEGSSNNKAVEIFNASSNTVNLTDYKILRYNNGSATPTDSLHMAGQLLPGAVFVAGNPTAVATILAVSDTLHTITFFNGDDVLVLVNKTTNTVLDIIGIIGVDPGVSWPVGTGATSEFTLVRMPSIHQGNLDWALSVTEWLVYPQNTDTTLGAHTMTSCCTGTPPGFLNLSYTETNCQTGVASLTFSVQNGTAPYTYTFDGQMDTVGTDTVWATNVISYSTQYGNVNWAAFQALGEPNTYPAYGDISTAWTSQSSDGGREFMVVGFPTSIASNVLVYETYNPGFTDTVYVREAATGNWIMIYSDTAMADTTISIIQNYPIPSTIGAVDAVRLAMDCAAVPSWNEIDAIGLVAPNTVSIDSIVVGSYTLSIGSAASACTADTLIDIVAPPAIATSQSFTICSNQEIEVGGNYYNTTGVYVDVLTSKTGCDSTVTTTLTVNPGSATYFDQILTICAGSSITVGTNTYTVSGFYMDTLANAEGCDSVVTTDLTVYSTNTPAVTITELMQANMAFGGTATASDEYSGNPAADAFDGDIITTGWANNGDSLPSWLEYDFGMGNGKVITGYAFYCSEDMQGGWDWEGYDPSAWYFQGYNGTSWDTLDAQSFATVAQNVWHTFAFQNTTAYEKYRMYIYGSYDGDYAMITELELLADASCANRVFEAAVNAVAEPATFQWNLNGTPIQGETSQKLLLPAFKVGDVVSCDIVTTNACASDTAATDLFTITAGASAATNTLSICPGESIMVGNSTYTTTGTYVDTLVSASGCDSVITTVLTVSGAVNVATTTSSENETITASAANATYQWIDCAAGNAPIAGATSQTFAPTVTGSYAVIVTQGNCTDTSACVSLSVGIDKSILRNAVSVFPNPNNGTFVIRASADGIFTLMNALGQTVETIELNAANNRETTFTSRQAAGVYFLKGNDGVLYSKVVINP